MSIGFKKGGLGSQSGGLGAYFSNFSDGAAAGATYLLQATFTADNQSISDAQVLDTTAEGVETGSLTAVINDGGMDIASNKLSFTAQTTASHGDLSLVSGSLTRALGLTAVAKLTGAVGKYGPYLIFTNTATYSAFGTDFVHGANLDGNDKLAFFGPVNTYKQSISSTNTTEYSFAIVLGGYNTSETPYQNGDTADDFKNGAHYFVKGGSEFTTWTLFHTEATDTTATLYAYAQDYDSGGAADDFHVYDSDATLSALLETSHIDTSVATNDTFTHEADGVIEIDITTLVTSGNLDIEFRIQDASNKWICRCTSGNAVSLVEVVATVETTRIGPVAAAVADGYRVLITADDEEITLVTGTVGETTRGAYSSAANFKTDTGGKIVFGTGAIAHVAGWKRNGYTDLDSY